MNYLFSAALNGQPLSTVAPEILLYDIAENPEELTVGTVSRANKDGTRLSQRQRKSLSVQLTFAIRTQDVARRSQIMQDVMVWARSGAILTVNTRPGQQLTVTVDKLPSITSALKWTEELTITFVAYAKPYWESDTAITTSFRLYEVDSSTLLSGGGQIRPVGTIPQSAANVMVVNTSELLMTYLHVTCHNTYMELTGLTVLPGGYVQIAYDNDDLLMISVNGDNAMQYRTAESSDDLLCEAYMDNNIVVTANCSATVTAATRGRWL